MPYYGRRRTWRRRNPRRNRRQWRGRGRRSPRATYNAANVTKVMRLPMTIMPDRAISQLKYTSRFRCDNVNFSGNYQFTQNGLFDPDITSTGAQPPGFDQWMAFYKRYRVFASSCKITIISEGDNSLNSTGTFSLTPLSGTGVVAANDPFINGQSSRGKMLHFTPSGPRNYLKSYVKTADITGVPDLDDDLFYGSSISNPTRLNAWHISYISADQLSPLSSLSVIIELTYFVEFNARQQLDYS